MPQGDVPRVREIRQLGGHTPWFTGGWPVTAVAFDARGEFLLAGGDRGLRLFHAATGELVRRFEERGLGVYPQPLSFSNGGENAVAHVGRLNEKQTMGVWDVESGAFLRVFEATVETLVAIDREGRRAITANNNEAAVWDLGSEKVLHRIGKDRGGFGPAAFLGGGERAIVHTASDSAFLWEIGTGKILWEKKIGPSYSLAGSPDGAWFAAGAPGAVRIHDAETGELRHSLAVPEEKKPFNDIIKSIVISGDARRIAGTAMLRLFAWDAQTRALLHAETLPPPWFEPALAIAPGGASVVIGMSEGNLRRVGLERDEPHAEADPHRGHLGPVLEVSFDDDGSIRSADATWTLLWRGESVAEATATHASAGRAPTLAAPAWLDRIDGLVAKRAMLDDKSIEPAFIGANFAAAISGDGEVYVWDPALSDDPIATLVPGSAAGSWPGRAHAIALHPDGRRLAIATSRTDAPVQLWDARAGRLEQICEGHESAARSVAFSKDGSLLASGSDDRTVRVYRVV